MDPPLNDGEMLAPKILLMSNSFFCSALPWLGSRVRSMMFSFGAQLYIEAYRRAWNSVID